MNFNQATVVGRLTRDPEMKALPSGSNVTSFSIATSRKYKDREGNMQEQTEFHNVVVFGGQAEPCSKYLTKGKIAMVIGRLQTRSWETDGVKHYRTEIVADNVVFGPFEPSKEVETVPAGDVSQVEYPEEDIDPSQIPF